MTVDSPEDAKTKQLEKGQPTQEGHVEKTEAQGVKDEVSPVAFQGCRKEEAKQSNLSAEEANSSFVSIYNVFFPHPVVDLFSPDVQQVSNNEQRYQWKDMFI